jgi:hypothetical protein
MARAKMFIDRLTVPQSKNPLEKGVRKKLDRQDEYSEKIPPY